MSMVSKFALVLGAATALLASGCGSHAKLPAGAGRAGETPPTPHKQRPAPTRAFRVTLTGSNQVLTRAPTVSAVAVVSLRPSTTQVCWRFLNIRNITKPTAAYIHGGARDVNGPVVVPFGATYAQRGCIRVAPSVVNAIASAPGVYYLSLVTARHPKGAVRAQL